MRQIEVQIESAVAYLQKINWDGVAEGGLNLAGNEIWSVVSVREWSVVVERGGSFAWMILDLIVAELGHEWTHSILE